MTAAIGNQPSPSVDHRSSTRGLRTATMKWMSAVVAATVVLMGGGIASATVFGPDADGAGAGALEVTAVLGSSDLYPGATGDLTFTVTNSSDEAATFATLVSGTVVSSDPTNCPADNVVVTSTTDLALHVPAHSSPVVTASDVVTMVRSAPDGCQGVSFTISVQLAGAAG